ncbi:MAG: hypothetical protein QF425_11585, partial [Dehalococcoidia bacterium]|nr:hypothetical protein [Dehalococcoidia bacterium]
MTDPEQAGVQVMPDTCTLIRCQLELKEWPMRLDLKRTPGIPIHIPAGAVPLDDTIHQVTAKLAIDPKRIPATEKLRE